MSEFFLGVISIGELVAFVAYVYLTNKEKAKLVNALMSKDSTEFVHNTLADQTKIEPEIKSNPDLLPIENLNEEEFDKHIQEELNG